ncbi:helix-turn-helix domain-containing protein [Paenibacillus sp. GCM10027626]|uniref:helix-turn-helix domain-containing protein n=1 Tax=Paenibacillus sp. GCM10027626 TaxID=3273411 RepID=UPI003638C317
MPATIELSNLNEYFDRFSALLDGQKQHLTGDDGVRTVLAPQFGEGSITRIPIRRGMEVVITDMMLDEDMKLHVQNSYGLFELNYCLDGQIYCAWEGNEHYTGQHNGNVFFMENIELYMEKKGGVRTQTVEIRFSPDELLRYVAGTSDQVEMEKLLARHKGKLSRYEDSPAIQRCVHDLFHIHRQGPMKRLFAECKIMELIALIAGEQAADEHKVLSIALTADDVRKLKEARELIVRRLENPLSVKELALHVGLNEYKLKRGFREYHGMTIFELVRQERMKRAIGLMEDEGLNVSETAAWLGYSNMSNFTAAFRKQYGVNPGQYIKALNRRIERPLHLPH